MVSQLQGNNLTRIFKRKRYNSNAPEDFRNVLPWKLSKFIILHHMGIGPRSTRGLSCTSSYCRVYFIQFLTKFLEMVSPMLAFAREKSSQ